MNYEHITKFPNIPMVRELRDTYKTKSGKIAPYFFVLFFLIVSAYSLLMHLEDQFGYKYLSVTNSYGQLAVNLAQFVIVCAVVEVLVAYVYVKFLKKSA